MGPFSDEAAFESPTQNKTKPKLKKNFLYLLICFTKLDSDEPSYLLILVLFFCLWLVPCLKKTDISARLPGKNHSSGNLTMGFEEPRKVSSSEKGQVEQQRMVSNEALFRME